MSGPTSRPVIAALAALVLSCGASEPLVSELRVSESTANEAPSPERTTETTSVDTAPVDTAPVDTPPEVSHNAPTIAGGDPEAVAETSFEASTPAEAAVAGEPPSPEDSEPSRGVPRIRVFEGRVGPVYPRELVRRVIRRRFDDVRRCFERHATENLCVDGVTVEFTIEGDGAVGQRHARSSREGQTLAPETAACFEHAFGNMRFPRPPGQSRMYIRYPLLVNCAG